MQQANKFRGRGEKMTERTKERTEKENKEVKNLLLQQPIDYNAPGAVDEYLRNFLRKAGLTRTLNSFDSEWHDTALNSIRESLQPEIPLIENSIPDACTHRQLLRNKLEEVRKDSDQLRQELLLAPEILVRLQRETFFHQQQGLRTCNEKTRLEEEIKKLQKQLESYEQSLEDLEKKHEESLKQKTLLCMEQERNKNVPRRKRECLIMKERKFSSDCTDKTSAKAQRPGLVRDAKFSSYGSQVKLQQIKVQQVKLQQMRVQQVEPQQVKPQQVNLPETDSQQLKSPQPKPQQGESQPVKPQQAKTQKLDYYEIDFQQFKQEDIQQAKSQHLHRHKMNGQQEANQQGKPQPEDQPRLNPHHSSNCKINLHQLKKHQKNQQVKTQRREQQQVKKQQLNSNEVKIKHVKHKRTEDQETPGQGEQQQVRPQQKQHQRLKPQQKQPQLEEHQEAKPQEAKPQQEKPQQVNRSEMKMKHLKYHQLKLQQIKNQIPKIIRKPKIPSPFSQTCVIHQLHQLRQRKLLCSCSGGRQGLCLNQ